MLQTYERVVCSSLAEVYERPGGQGNLSFERSVKGPKGLRDAFYDRQDVEKTFWFAIYLLGCL